MSQVRNLNAVRLGTGEVLFSPGATSVADAQSKGYVDLGNIVNISSEPENEMLEHEGSYRGIKRVDARRVIKSDFAYKIQADEISHEQLLLFLLGVAGTPFTQSALVSESGQALAFDSVAAVPNRWYNLYDSSGNRVREITSVTIATKTENTDFFLDKKTGRIRFAVAESTSLTPVIDAPAVSSSDTGYLKNVQVLQETIKTGYGRVMIFDDSNANKLVYDHVDFSCQVMTEGSLEFDGKKFTELTLKMTVTDEKGGVFHKE